MTKRLNCRQVEALINFYNEGCLTELLTKYVEEHLQNCPECQAKYMQPITENTKNIEENNYLNNQYEIFKKNLSAYIDNELNDSDNIKIKKIAISNPKARKDLEDSYNFKRIMHSVYEKTKNDFKTDYSKDIINEFSNQKRTKYDPFYKLAASFFIMIIFLMLGLIKILHF